MVLRGKPCITHHPEEHEVVDRITACGYPVSTVCVHNTTGVKTTYFSGPRPGVAGRLTKGLQGLGVYTSKHIPQDYKLSSVDQRLQLLAGIIDTDGATCKKTSRIIFATCSQALANDVAEITRSLGWRTYITEVQPTLSSSGIQGRQVVYQVGFNPLTDIPVQLERKKVKHFPVRRRIGIKAIYADTPEMGHCIQVDSEDGLYLAGRLLTPTHNSEIASRTFPPWFLGRNPSMDVIACSHGASLAESFSRKARDLAKTDMHQSVFPEMQIDPNAQGVKNWMTTHGGGYLPAGVDGPIVGRGFNVGIIDDVHKSWKEADSENIRDDIWDWYTGVFYNRAAPGAGIILIMTRWHHDDLAGRLLEDQKHGGDKWELVEYPAIAVDDEVYRRKGEPLHPERYDLTALERIKRVSGPAHGRLFSSKSQQQTRVTILPRR